jgi:hypothetical protein
MRLLSTMIFILIIAGCGSSDDIIPGSNSDISTGKPSVSTDLTTFTEPVIDKDEQSFTARFSAYFENTGMGTIRVYLISNPIVNEANLDKEGNYKPAQGDFGRQIMSYSGTGLSNKNFTVNFSLDIIHDYYDDNDILNFYHGSERKLYINLASHDELFLLVIGEVVVSLTVDINHPDIMFPDIFDWHVVKLPYI